MLRMPGQTGGDPLFPTDQERRLTSAFLKGLMMVDGGEYPLEWMSPHLHDSVGCLDITPNQACIEVGWKCNVVFSQGGGFCDAEWR